ncbi:alpha/beta hydrolase [Phenylobacterium sp.]|uniref:alpha/beta hydrolase n=1 Tax=Phenylobacterium sp. TaxID=1871053 RepID=UPI0035B0A385
MKPILEAAVVIAAGAAISLALVAGAGAQTSPLRERWRAKMEERMQQRAAEESRPVDLAAIAPGARKLTASYGPAPLQAIDVYVPPNARHAPVIVMVHGGAWKIGDKANHGLLENKLRHWLPMGYVFVSVDYRMLPEAMALEQASDVAAAVRFVQAHAAGWGADPARLVLMGHSAGAHLVALISADPSMVGRRWAGTVVLDSAAMDVPAVMGKRHARFYDEAFGADPAYWARTSPIDRWTAAAEPMLLVCALKRPDDSCGQARAFAAKAERAGRPTPVSPQDLTHREVNENLGLPGAYTDAVDRFIAQRLAARG